MKILFAIQGTGNGHLSRAKDVYPELAKYGQVDVLISGIQADVAFPYPVKYKRYSISFIFGKRGGVDIKQTLRKLRPLRFIKDAMQLPVAQYDLVVNDFEPVSAWACKMKGIKCISLSHQCAVLHKDAPIPDEKDSFGKWILQHYAPCTDAYGFHFMPLGDNVATPVIRQEIRAIQPTNKGHYTVYLPAYSDETLIQQLTQYENAQWQVFSKHNTQPVTVKNVTIQPIENNAFIRSMAGSIGVLCGGGFEGPAEAMFLGKKLLVIPMDRQYEQQCNASALEKMGVMVIKKLDNNYYDQISRWITEGKPVPVNYPDKTGKIVADLVAAHMPDRK